MAKGWYSAHLERRHRKLICFSLSQGAGNFVPQSQEQVNPSSRKSRGMYGNQRIPPRHPSLRVTPGSANPHHVLHQQSFTSQTNAPSIHARLYSRKPPSKHTSSGKSRRVNNRDERESVAPNREKQHHVCDFRTCFSNFLVGSGNDSCFTHPYNTRTCVSAQKGR